MAIVVRAARPEEAEGIAAWNAALAEETEGLSLDRDVLLAGTRAVFEQGHGARYLRAEVDGEVAGQCMWTVESTEKSESPDAPRARAGCSVATPRHMGVRVGLRVGLRGPGCG